MGGSRGKPEKKKQHKGLENRGKISKEQDYRSLQKVKDQLTQQQIRRKKEMVERPTENRYNEIRQAMDTPEAPVVEHAAAKEAYRTQYFGEFRKVVEHADVLLEVLDSRDPLGCRSKKLEDFITKKGKRIVLILNKCDLIPVDVLNKWLAYLRREFPTMPFKSTSQPNKANYCPLHEGKWRSTDCFGVNELIQLLNKLGCGSTITAGVIGPPNSGKSSVINSLARRQAAGVASTPGFTKQMQEIEVTQRIRILDCPGVVQSGSADEITPSMILRNSIKIELLDDPVSPVAYILERVPKEQLISVYETGTFADAEDFLSQLAKKRGRVLKGGDPDIESVARTVLDDWNKGRIHYYTIPPEVDNLVEAKTELVDQDGTVFPMGKVMDFGIEDFRNVQVQHVFQVVNRGKEARNVEKEEKVESSEDEVKSTEIPKQQKEEMDDIAKQFEGVSFGDL